MLLQVGVTDQRGSGDKDNRAEVLIEQIYEWMGRKNVINQKMSEVSRLKFWKECIEKNYDTFEAKTTLLIHCTICTYLMSRSTAKACLTLPAAKLFWASAS